jgi:hypothetical protein
MTTKCIQCGRDNDDSALLCVCGAELGAGADSAPAPATGPTGKAEIPADEPGFRLRKAVFLLWGIAFVPGFALARSLLHVGPVYRNLIGTAIFAASAAAAFWLLGREKRLALRVWRIVFVVWALLVLPLLLNVAQGVAEEGWPSGRFNRQVARILVLILVLTIPAFLTGLAALIRTYRVASGLALVTGPAYLVDGVLLIRATAPAHGLRLRFQNVLDIVLFGAQMGSYLSIPIGIALIVGGILIFRATRARATAPISGG